MNYSQIQIRWIARRSLMHLCIVATGLSGFVLSVPVAADDQLPAQQGTALDRLPGGFCQ